MIRNPSTATVSAFYAAANSATIACKDSGYQSELELIQATEQIVESALAHIDKGALDPAIASFVHLTALWSNELNSSFTVLHDESKIIGEYKHFLLGLMDQSVEPVKIECGRMSQVYPLNAIGILFGDSKQHPQLQVADMIAGAVYHWSQGILSHSKQDDFWKALKEKGLEKLIHAPIWPSSDVTPEQLGAFRGDQRNPADVMRDYLLRQSRRP